VRFFAKHRVYGTADLEIRCETSRALSIAGNAMEVTASSGTHYLPNVPAVAAPLPEFEGLGLVRIFL
jgi:hypothetical protein